MKSALILGVTLLTAALPAVAAAQAPKPNAGDLELQRKQKRSVVLPKQNPDQVRADADRAVSEYAATRPTPGRTVRETSPVRPPARPDLDYDVRTGIQSERIGDALRGR
jgi:hypothetical protein